MDRTTEDGKSENQVKQEKQEKEEKEEKEVRNAVCDLLKNARKQLRLTQKEVADKLQVRREAVAQWERAQGNPPSPENLVALSALYHLDMDAMEEIRKTKGSEGRPRHGDLHFEHGRRPLGVGRPLPCFVKLPNDFRMLHVDIIRAIDARTGILWRQVNVDCDELSFFLQMKGVSMQPRIPDGTWVAFDPIRIRKPREHDIILLKGESGDAFIAELIIDQGQKYASSINPAFSRSVLIQKDTDILAVGIEAHILLLSSTVRQA